MDNIRVKLDQDHLHFDPPDLLLAVADNQTIAEIIPGNMKGPNVILDGIVGHHLDVILSHHSEDKKDHPQTDMI